MVNPELDVLTREDLEEAFKAIGRTRNWVSFRVPRLGPMGMPMCVFYGHGYLPQDEDCLQCTAANGCEELTNAPLIKLITDPAELPRYLASDFDLVRIFAINRLAQLLREQS